MYADIRHLRCVLVLALTLSHKVMSESYEDRAALRTTVLTNYTTDIRPLNDQSQVLNISVTAVVYKILTVDAVQGTMSLVISFVCTWTDERITWAPNDYNNTKSLQVYKNNVWIPHLSIGNPVEFLVLDKYFMHVTYTHEGMAFFHAGDVVEMMCQFNVRFWPFDHQECSLELFAYDQSVTDVQFVNVRSDTSTILPNSEWTLLGVEQSTAYMYGHSFALFKFKLQRQSSFYLLQIIVPLLGIGTLNPFVFLLPSESGERVSYSTTILLSITVFLTIIGENMPKTSNPLPLMVVLLTMAMAMSLVTSLSVILNLYVYHRDDEKHPVNRICRKFVYFVSKTSCPIRTQSRVEPVSILPDNVRNTKLLRKNSRSLPDNDLGTRNVSDKNDTSKKSKVEEHTRWTKDDDLITDVTWKDVSYAIDKIAFVSSLILNIIVSVSFVCYLIVASNN